MDRTVSPSGCWYVIFCLGGDLGAALRRTGSGHHHGGGYIPGSDSWNQCGAIQQVREQVMRACLSVLLLCLVFISVLVIALVILFEYGGLAFVAFAVIASCAVGVVANYILEKKTRRNKRR